MTPVQILFILVAAVTLGAALMVVTVRNLVHAALWLILALFGIAVFYVLLNAGFLAVAQVVVYIGAIAILFIFTIMLTRRVAQDSGPQVNPNWVWASILSIVLFAGLAWMLNSWSGFHSQAPQINPRIDQVVQLGQALVSPNAYVLAFELASVLLLAALVGSIIIAWEKKEEVG
jgi:NADH-quinone oxidoreductase subunit J